MILPLTSRLVFPALLILKPVRNRIVKTLTMDCGSGRRKRKRHLWQRERESEIKILESEKSQTFFSSPPNGFLEPPDSLPSFVLMS